MSDTVIEVKKTLKKTNALKEKSHRIFTLRQSTKNLTVLLSHSSKIDTKNRYLPNTLSLSHTIEFISTSRYERR